MEHWEGHSRSSFIQSKSSFDVCLTIILLETQVSTVDLRWLKNLEAGLLHYSIPSCSLPVPLTEHVATTTMFDNQDTILWFESLTFTAPNIWSHLIIKHFSRRLQIQSSLKVLILEQTLPSRSAPSQPIVVWFPVDCRLELCWFVSCCQTAKPISSPVRITVWVFFQSLESGDASE